MLKRIILFLTFFAMLAVVTTASVAQSDTGLPSYETVVPINAYESVNVGNLNVLLTAPVRSKNGPVPVSLSLTQNAQLYVWQPLAGHGYFYNTTAGPFTFRVGDYWTGRLSTSDTGYYAVCNGLQSEIYNILAIVDGTGTSHPLPANTKWDKKGCSAAPALLVTTDNSGYTMQEYANSSLLSVYTRSGFGSTYDWQPNGGVNGSVVIQDQHGNTLSIAAYNASITDGMSSASILSQSNTVNAQYTYTDGTGTLRTVTEVDDNSTGMLPNFNTAGCFQNQSGGSWFPLSITYPDNSALHFTWQKTSAGHYNGFLSTVQIPTGATFTHTYSGGTNGEGFWCDTTHNIISLATLTISNGTGTWTFARTVGGGTYPNRTITTTLTKPDGSKVVYTFIGDNSPILTSKVVKDTDGTTVLDTWTYCYDSNNVSCNPNPPTNHPGYISAYHYVPGVANPAAVVTFYDTYGNVTQAQRWDFGPTLVSKNVITYGSWNGSSCQSMASAHITAKPCINAQFDSGNNQLGQSVFTYNTSTGDLLTKYDNTSSTTNLAAHFTYNSNGTLASLTRPDGAQTTYTYTQCNGLLPDSATSAIGTAHQTWDCNGALLLTTTDLNGLVTTMTYGDPLYRVTQVSNNGGQAPTVFTYSPNQNREWMVFNGTSNLVETSHTVDSLGRLISLQHEQGWALPWDTVSYTYDATGHRASVSQPCSTSTLGGTCPTAATTYTYDGMGRPKTQTTVSSAGTGVLTYSYPYGTVLMTLSPAPTGENNKSVDTIYDGLGRVTGICQMTSGLAGNGGCGTRYVVNGYYTSFTLDALGRPTQISRNVQAGGTPRNTTLQYDWLSRITQKTVTETGTSSFLYDVANGSTCTAFLAGHLTSATDNLGNVVCFGYDSMGRKTVDTTNAGPYASTSKVHIFAYDSNPQGGGHLIGRLARAFTCVWPCSTAIVDEQFGYDVYGRKTDVWQTSPALAGSYFHTTASYFDNGALKALGGIPGVSSYTFTLDAAGRPYKATSGAQTPVSSVTRDPASNPLIITYGTGDSDTYQWDPATENTTQYQFKLGSAGTTDTGVLTWNPNGTLQKLAITDNITSADTQTCTTAHDDIARITAFNCGALWNESYAFSANDAGNVTKSGSLSFAPGYNAANNQMLSPYTYDANGQMLHDATLSQDYTWDAYGTVLSAGSATIVNDGFGHIVEKTVSGVNTFYVQSPVGSLGAASSLTAYSSIRAPLPGGGTMNYQPGYQFIEHKDWMGSTRLVSTWGNRSLKTVLCYGPMGEIYCGQSAYGDFEGSHQDTSSGLDDFDVTRYSGAQGRNISPTGGANGYVKTNSPF